MSASPPTAAGGLTVFFPAYNDAGTITSMVIGAVIAARRLTDDFEIVVINDGSQDATAEVLEELARMCPTLRVITHPENRGYGAALRTGFKTATKEFVFYTDGDAQYDPRELADLWARMAPGSIWSMGTRSAGPTHCTGSSSAGSITTSSRCSLACGCATSTATSG